MTLFVVATPIGNLRDISARAMEVLASVDFILCEDTRRTRQLLSALDISSPALFSCHAHNEKQKSHWVISRLLDGENAALVCDAGTPAISDPGREILSVAYEFGVDVRCVVGPSALSGALSICGFSISPFHFLGFPPRKAGQRRKWLIEGSSFPGSLVIFESGKRIGELILEIQKLMPDRMGCICRELTKLYEEVLRGSVMELPTGEQKGEIVLVLGPGKTFQEKKKQPEGLKEIAAALGDIWGISKRNAYNFLVKNKPK